MQNAWRCVSRSGKPNSRFLFTESEPRVIISVDSSGIFLCTLHVCVVRRPLGRLRIVHQVWPLEPLNYLVRLRNYSYGPFCSYKKYSTRDAACQVEATKHGSIMVVGSWAKVGGWKKILKVYWKRCGRRGTWKSVRWVLRVRRVYPILFHVKPQSPTFFRARRPANARTRATRDFLIAEAEDAAYPHLVIHLSTLEYGRWAQATL